MKDVMRLLLIEDLPTDAALAEREIRRVLPGSTFLCVDAQEDFLAALGAFRPDVILADYKLPRFDGMTALRLALQHVPETPFIVVTGSMNEATAVECMKAGAWDYVIKEHIGRLGSAVLAALEQRRLRVERRQAAEAQCRQAEELRLRNDELSRFNDAAVGRELRMLELKREVNDLCARLGEPTRYRLVDEAAEAPAVPPEVRA